MAERPDENYEMRDRIPEDEDEQPQYQETSFDEPTLDETIVTDDTGVDVSVSSISNISEDEVESMRLRGLRNVFLEITGVPIESRDNEDLFRKTKITIGPTGHKIVWFDGKKIYYKNKGEYTKWTEYVNIALRNPMEAEFEKAKESYGTSVRKQTNDIAGVNLPKKISADVVMNVLTEMFDDLDIETEFETTGTQTEDGSQVKGVDVEKLQARLRTLDKVIGSQEKNFYKKNRVLNELKARNANDDVISSKEVEINDLQDKLKKVKAQRDELLDEVEVGDIILKDTLDEVKSLKEENNNVKEKFKKFKEAAEREKDIATRNAAQRYWETKRVDENRAREEYNNAVTAIRKEHKAELRVAESEQKELGDRLKEAEEKLKYLQQAEHKQHGRPSSAKPDWDSTDRVVPGVQQSIDRIYSIIEKSDPKYDELSDDELERDLDANMNTLREQAKKFEQKAENSKGVTKQVYENIQKSIELKIDEINLRLDRQVEYEVTKQKLKEEVENNPGVRWERLKKWIKDNRWGVLSVTFGVGSFIAGVIMAVRGAVKTTAKGVSSFGQSLVKVLKKLGPVFAALGSILMTALGILSQGLLFLANNLWILLVLLAMFLWNYFKKYFEKGRTKKE